MKWNTENQEFKKNYTQSFYFIVKLENVKINIYDTLYFFIFYR